MSTLVSHFSNNIPLLVDNDLIYKVLHPNSVYFYLFVLDCKRTGTEIPNDPEKIRELSPEISAVLSVEDISLAIQNLTAMKFIS